MIPSDLITASPIVGVFYTPYDATYTKLLQKVRGGAAIGDPSQGRNVKNWIVSYSGGNIQVYPEGEAVAFVLPAAGVLTVSLAFDTNMGVTIAYTTSAGAALYYYDSLLAAYTTRNFAGYTSCRLVVDDTRNEALANSDVIFAYTRSGNLYWRQQRDRYNVERIIGATSKNLIRMGPCSTGRLQFELK